MLILPQSRSSTNNNNNNNNNSSSSSRGITITGTGSSLSSRYVSSSRYEINDDISADDYDDYEE